MSRDGGPAFPRPQSELNWSPDCPPEQFDAQRGMTLRDYFAGQALVGIMTEGTSDNPPTIAKAAYLIADAMLAERAKEQA